MSWKDLAAIVPLDPDVDFDDEILGWKRDDSYPTLDDDDMTDDDSLSPRECDDFEFIIDPLDEARDKLTAEIKAIVCRQDTSHLVATYLRSGSRHDLIDVYWLSKMDGFPYYKPSYHFMMTRNELQEEVKPISFKEMPLFVTFAEDIQALYQSVRDEVLATQGQLLKTRDGAKCLADCCNLDNHIRNEIVMRTIIDGEKAVLAK